MILNCNGKLFVLFKNVIGPPSGEWRKKLLVCLFVCLPVNIVHDDISNITRFLRSALKIY